MDKVLADTEAQFKAKITLLRNMFQEAEIKIKADTKNAAMKYKEKIQAGKRQLDVREQELKEWEGRIKKEEEDKGDELRSAWKELEARQATLLAAEKRVTEKKLSSAVTQKALEGNKKALQDRRKTLAIRKRELKEWEARLQKEEDWKRDQLEVREAAVVAAEKEATARKLRVIAAQKALEGNKMDLLDHRIKLDVRENRLDKIKQEMDEQKDLLHMKKDDLERKSKSLEEREAKLEAKEKDLEEIADRECAVTLREEEACRRVANVDVEDHGWIEANEFIATYEGNTSPELQQRLSALLLDIAGTAGMIPVLKKSFTVKFEAGLKGKTSEEAASIVAATGIDDLDGILNLVKNLAKYIKAQR